MKLAGLFMLMLLLLQQPSHRIDDTEAFLKAISIWGNSGQIAKVKRKGVVDWLYQVGCYFPDKTIAGPSAFMVAGQGFTWEEAFASVDMAKNGPSAELRKTFAGGNEAFRCNPMVLK